MKENEPFDVALRRFKRSCEKAGVLAEVRRREFYEKPTAVRKRKAAAAVKRHLKKLQRENRKSQKFYWSAVSTDFSGFCVGVILRNELQGHYWLLVIYSYVKSRLSNTNS